MTKGGASGATSGSTARKISATGPDSTQPALSDQLSSLTNIKPTQPDVLPELQCLTGSTQNVESETTPLPVESGVTSDPVVNSDPVQTNESAQSNTGVNSYNNNTEKNDLTSSTTQSNPLIGSSLASPQTSSGENK